MARCKACDTMFSDSDYDDSSGNNHELCSYCRFVSDNPEYFVEKEYQFEGITEIPVYIENYENTLDKS